MYSLRMISSPAPGPCSGVRIPRPISSAGSSLVSRRVCGRTTIKSAGDGAMVTEQTAPRGSGSPLHVHHNEDEWFYVLEGELTIWVEGETHVAPAGSFFLGPRDIPHTFIVSSEMARFL